MLPYLCLETRLPCGPCFPEKSIILIMANRLMWFILLYPPHNEVVGGILVSLRPSVRPSVRPASRVRSVASTVQDGFFPYLVQMINRMRACVPCDDP